jgi:hypothetical protein
MKLQKVIKSAFCIIVLIISIEINAQQSCDQKIKDINGRQSGIPVLVLNEYEACVTSLETHFRPEYKSILKDAYRNLIQYFDAIDNQTKVDFYRNKLHLLETR